MSETGIPWGGNGVELTYTIGTSLTAWRDLFDGIDSLTAYQSFPGSEIAALTYEDGELWIRLQ